MTDVEELVGDGRSRYSTIPKKKGKNPEEGCGVGVDWSLVETM